MNKHQEICGAVAFALCIITAFVIVIVMFNFQYEYECIDNDDDDDMITIPNTAKLNLDTYISKVMYDIVFESDPFVVDSYDFFIEMSAIIPGSCDNNCYGGEIKCYISYIIMSTPECQIRSDINGFKVDDDDYEQLKHLLNMYPSLGNSCMLLTAEMISVYPILENIRLPFFSDEIGCIPAKFFHVNCYNYLQL